MNILVINGSPKGQYSTTLQTSLYLEILHPEHTFSYLDAGKKILQLEKDFTPASEAVSRADLLLFSYPVYTFLAPSQLHRFIALLKADGCAAGKFATQLTTSKHFYDVTAHAYVRDNCLDMGLKFIDGLSADMEDLTHERGRRQAEAFFDRVVWSMENGIFTEGAPACTPPEHVPATLPSAPAAPTEGDIVIVADLAAGDAPLAAMVARFQAVSTRRTRLVNIHDFPFRGGCISCFNCSTDGTCIYQDGFQELLRGSIQSAEAIVLAFSIADHSMGTVFKTYDDRQFCNGHRTVTMGKPFGYLVSGSLSAEENLRLVIRARAEVGGNYLAGVATDERDTDAAIDQMARSLCRAIETHYQEPANFYGVGGMKIFRDLIYEMQGMMKADHRFYKAHGQYDFPQKKRGTVMAMYLVGAMMGSKKIKAKMGSKMNEGMLMPYGKALRLARERMGIQETK